MYVTQMDSPLTIIMELLLLPLVEELFFIFSLIDGLRLREEPKSPFRKALWCEIKRNYYIVLCIVQNLHIYYNQGWWSGGLG